MSIVGIVEDILCENRNIDAIEGRLAKELEMNGEKSYIVPAVRLLKAYRENKMIDMCGHLRQCLIYYKKQVVISERIYNEIFKYKNRFGFNFHRGDEFIYVNVENYIMKNEPDLSSKYLFAKRRKREESISDGRMYRYYGYKSYTSLSQKLLNYFICNMKERETLLACLPTGGGKSLSWQLPSISKMYQGTIIVVVPTVALAMDHEKTSRDFYENVFGEQYYPKAYSSDLKTYEKQQILDQLKAGKLPVLYISPEALQRREFKQIVFEAAEEGKVSALIIDEVHLVVSWGMKFRPEFQLLSAFKKQLQDLCDLKTILLSATLKPSDTEVIKNIFGGEEFIEFRADQLRTEPSYYSHECKSERERKNLIKELIDKAPRPIILYVVTPDQGNEYLEILKTEGYHNISTFSGLTTKDARKKIIEEWNKDKIDIMVATSAFGMGVDKSDVRTILTGYIPESISRFYQEVGRAGRDGYSSLNYMLYNYEMDNGIVDSLTKSSVITVELLLKRWIPLLSQSIRESSDTVWIDVNIPPEHLRFTLTGKKNAEWNKDIILLLYRAGLIDILDFNITGYNEYAILVRLLKIGVLEDAKQLAEYITPFRDAERQQINIDISNVHEMINGEECYSKYLEREFPYVAATCSGCPFCRKNELDNFAEKNQIIIETNKKHMYDEMGTVIDKSIETTMKYDRSIMLSYNDELHTSACVEFLIKNGINVIIAEEYDASELLERIKYYEQYNYILLTYNEAISIDLKWLNGRCALIYPSTKAITQLYYFLSEKYLNVNDSNIVIHIAHMNAYIESETKLLNELVDENLLLNNYIKEDLYANS